MRYECHQLLGHYLAERFLTEAPRRCRRAFLLGCVEPDWNYATYIKGSIRASWFRGHNWSNSQRYVGRVSRRLDARERLRMLDFYRLGKLIHYTTDAFTYAHNDSFQENLRKHRSYERGLQGFFAQYLAEEHPTRAMTCGSIMDLIRNYHTDYVNHPWGVYNDSKYTLIVCTAILELLFCKSPESAE